MEDRIIVSPEMLEKWARDLGTVSEGLTNAANLLTNVETTEEAGGELSFSENEVLHSGARISGENVAEVLRSIYNAISKTDEVSRTIAAGLQTASKLFQEKEQEIISRIDQIGKGGGSGVKISAIEALVEEFQRRKNSANSSSDEDIMSQFSAIKDKHSREEDLKNANPHYGDGKQFHVNCQRCVIAYELRRRGYDVKALPQFSFTKTQRDILTPEEKEYFDYQYNIYLNWKNYFKDAQWLDVGVKDDSASTKSNIISQMKDFGPGARAEVYVCWQGSGAHVFIAENINGDIVFVDPQSGNADVSEYFNDRYIKAEETIMCRLDNLEPSDLIEGCVANSDSKLTKI